ncbi:T-cell-specific guanine nucleotide triphosphate-binding protein 2-like [Callorhinchus milii]|uniref:T-cell-specific guanine nucleotide triphosphate-binding protein 2-like n=1 Tax=Callorhinchus milii TaxID=7868 RepID=UPI001C3FBC89|nr:T-cell-specific guanine nucleotide triphosphate-binding protein 2-like [Callorhinchus milii]XP_042196590.1 T-cell-specific guanine nucleotide triphosphate-binding protein 2-like [Callorhinchus milii]
MAASKFFHSDEIIGLQSDYKTGGLGAILSQIRNKCSHLDEVQVNIAVAGEAGSGKSTFINAIRNLQSNAQGAAPTGHCETTTEPTMYPYPHLPNVQLWDLPAVNSCGLGMKRYLELVKFESYDFFIIVAQARFRENDAELAKKVQEQGKLCFYVRCKIDNDLHSLAMEGAEFTEDEEMKTIRMDCVANFQYTNIKIPPIFLISNFKLNKYDFPELRTNLVRHVPMIRSQGFTLALPEITREIMGQKIRSMVNRIWLLAVLAGAVGAVPRPGLLFVTCIGLVVAGLVYLQREVGLDYGSLYRAISSFREEPMSIWKTVKKLCLLSKLSPVLLATAVGCTVAMKERGFPPVTISLLGAAVSSWFTVTVLTDAVRQHVGAAQRAVKSMFDKDSFYLL